MDGALDPEEALHRGKHLRGFLHPKVESVFEVASCVGPAASPSQGMLLRGQVVDSCTVSNQQAGEAAEEFELECGTRASWKNRRRSSPVRQSADPRMYRRILFEILPWLKVEL